VKTPGFIEKLRKTRSKERAWDRDDVVQEFESKYVLHSPKQLKSSETTDDRTLHSSDENDSKLKLLNLINDLERMELLDTVNDHINHNKSLLDQERNELVSRAIHYVESELQKRVISEPIGEGEVPLSHDEKAAAFEYITVQNMKEDEPDDKKTALKLAKLKSILEEKRNKLSM